MSATRLAVKQPLNESGARTIFGDLLLIEFQLNDRPAKYRVNLRDRMGIVNKRVGSITLIMLDSVEWVK